MGWSPTPLPPVAAPPVAAPPVATAPANELPPVAVDELPPVTTFVDDEPPLARVPPVAVEVEPPMPVLPPTEVMVELALPPVGLLPPVLVPDWFDWVLVVPPTLEEPPVTVLEVRLLLVPPDNEAPPPPVAPPAPRVPPLEESFTTDAPFWPHAVKMNTTLTLETHKLRDNDLIMKIPRGNGLVGLTRLKTSTCRQLSTRAPQKTRDVQV